MKRIFILLWSIFCIAYGQAAVPDTAALLKKYPNANTVLLNDEEHIRYNPDGSSVSTDKFSYRILTPRGRDDLRRLNFRYQANYERLAVTALSIVKPDGKTITLEPEKLAVISIDSSQMSVRIYDPDSKQLSITVPGLEVGDTLCVTVKEETFKSRIPGQWSGFAVLQSDSPVLSYTYTIDAPASRPLLSIAVKDEAKGTLKFSQRTEDGRIIYQWQAKDVPQLIPEPGMPPLYRCAMRVLTSTAKNWSEIASWYAGLCVPRLAAVTPEMKKFVQKTVSGKKSDMEKISALFQYVSQRIRYTGITDEETAPGYEPHDVSRTFERGHGVCRDKAALLVSLLKLAGFKAHPVLFMSGYPKDEDVPNIYFNHAIVQVDGKDGKDILMDPTFETTTELFPAYLGNCSYLVATEKPTTLKRSPVIPAESNLLAINNQAEITGNTLSGKVEMNFKGIHDQMYRATFSEWKPEEVRRYFAGALRDIIPGAELKKCTITPANIRNMAEPLKVALTYTAPEFISGTGVAPLPLPEFASRFGTIRNLLNALKLEKRRFPLEALPRAVTEKFTLKLAPGITVKSIPDKADVSIPNVLRLSREIVQNGNILSGKNAFAIDTAEFTPADYLKAKAALAKFESRSKTLPLVQVAGQTEKKSLNAADYPGADSLIISDIRTIKLHTPNRWDDVRTVKRKIFTYGGAVTHSTVNIPYHPLMEDVEISGEFITPDGKKHILSDKEINRLDAPWAAAAKRYPAGKILTAAFPGVEPGSTVTYTITRKVKKKPYFYAEMHSRTTEPALLRKITVNAAENVDFHGIKPIEFTTFEDDKTLTAIITDQPGIVPESSAPALSECVPTLKVHSTDPAAFAFALNDALHKKIVITPEIKKLAEELKTPENIHKFVTENIIEAGPALNEAPWSIFSTPGETLKSGVGNSADRAILYGALCKALNLAFEFFAVSPIPDNKRLDDKRFVACHTFDRIILRLPLFERLFLNDSSRYYHATRLFSNYSTVLNLSTAETGLPPFHPVISPNLRIITAKIEITSKFSAKIKVTERFSGIYAEQLRRKLERATPEEMKQFFQSRCSDISRSAVLKNCDFSKPAVISYDFTVEDFLSKNGKFYTFELPGYKRISSELRLSGEKRVLPFQRTRSDDITMTYHIIIPDNMAFVQPETDYFSEASNNYPWATGFGYTRENDGKQRKIRVHLYLPFETISPDQYSRLFKLNKLLNTPALRQVILEERKK